MERLSTEVAKRDRRIRQLEQADRQAKQGASKALLEENRKLRGERELLRNTIKEFDSELVEVPKTLVCRLICVYVCCECHTVEPV